MEEDVIILDPVEITAEAPKKTNAKKYFLTASIIVLIMLIKKKIK